MGTLWQDMRYGIRMLAKNPGFTAVAVLTLALAIGANTAIFSVVNAVLLRPLPFAHADRIVSIYETLPSFTFNLPMNAPDFHAFSDRQRSFETLAIYSDRHYDLSGGGTPERIQGARASATLFPLLGVSPMLGRTYTADEDQPGHAVVVLSYGLWRRRYGKDPGIVGRSISLDRQPYTVIGVMPKDFEFPLRGSEWNHDPADLWVPMAFTPYEMQAWGNMYNHDVLALLKPGVMIAQARNDAAATIAEVEKLYPPDQLYGNGQHIGAVVFPFHQEVVGEIRTPLLVLLVAVGLVLLIACVNIANLILARASVRQKEVAIRAALGAGRGRLMRQMLSESLLLGIVSGAAGLFVAYWAKDVLVSLAPAALPRVHEAAIDARVLAFSILISLLTAIVFGIIPGIEASRTDPHEALKEGGRGTTPARARRTIQRALIVSQTALAVMLLIGAGLLLRSFARLLRTDPGFRPQHALAMTVSLPLRAYSHAGEIRNFYQELLRRTAALPEVMSVGASTDLPLDAQEHEGIEIEGRDASASALPDVTQSWIVGDYFAAMGITLKRGRAFTPADRLGASDVVIISESAARTYWPNQDPLGKRMRVFGQWSTVVGIVNDVKDSSIQKQAAPHSYTPYLAVPDRLLERPAYDELRTLHLAARTQGDPSAAASAVRGEIASLDPELAVADVKTMDADIQKSLAPQRFNLFLLGLFAALAIFLAAVGVYGVLSYSVTQRTHEIGVRMALGAQPAWVLAMTIREGMKSTLAGAAIGLLAALALTRLMASLLYGVTPHDPVTFLGVTLLMCGVALAACYIPARRAMRVDPMVALRYE
jgi:putative ABC transport system permease protein